VRELVDSAVLAGDGEALRRRLAADGYLFFRGVLPAGRVAEAGAAVARRLAEGGWTDGRGVPSATPKAVTVPEALRDRSYLGALASPEFNLIPYLPELRGIIGRVLGSSAFPYPAKVLRAVYPEGAGARSGGRYVHQDYGGAGIQDMLTSWVPLMDIPAEVGGLAVRPGWHLGPPRLPRVLGRDAPGWATTAYRPGDVLVFHCLLPHAALPNTAGVLRLSGDFRWQLPDGLAPVEMVYGPDSRPPELFSRLFRRQPWWQPVPGGLELRPRAELAARPPGPSRFFRVHPAWRLWRKPTALR